MSTISTAFIILVIVQYAFALMNLSITETHLARHQKNEKSRLSLFQDFDNGDSKLNLSKSDMKRIEDLRARNLQIPVLITGTCILPGQSMNIVSRDQKFKKLVDYAVRNDEEIGIIGVHPQSQIPLNFGVTATLSKESIKNNMIMGLSVTIEGKRQFEIEDKCFMDPSGSFYMARVEIVDDREENMTQEQIQAAERLSAKIPSLVKKWKELVQEKGMRKELNGLMKSVGPMPSCMKNRALWVGTLVNPLPDLKLCLEIRPAMLACKNNYERIQLAVLSIQHSIEFLSNQSQ